MAIENVPHLMGAWSLDGPKEICGHCDIKTEGRASSLPKSLSVSVRGTLLALVRGVTAKPSAGFQENPLDLPSKFSVYNG